MISKPKHGWCVFELDYFVGHPSDVTDVPMDLLNAFIDYYEKGSGVAVLDEEGSTFTLILTRYDWGIFVIEEREEPRLYDFCKIGIIDLTKELITDIESDLYGWAEFTCDDDPEEIKIHRDEIRQKLAELKKAMLK